MIDGGKIDYNYAKWKEERIKTTRKTKNSN
jgi:hypothetical protein